MAILERSNYQSNADFARAVGISPGTLHDLTAIDEDTGRPRRAPSMTLVRRLAVELRIPVTALLHAPEAVSV